MTSRTRPSKLELVVLASIITLFDLASKQVALVALNSSAVEVTPFLTLRLGFNAGVSFGMLQAQGTLHWMLLILVTSCLAIAVSYAAVMSRKPLERGGLAAMAGGAIANIIDRAADGRVTDFLDFHWSGWHWPTFNFADVAITMGVALFAGSAFLPLSKEAPRSPDR